VTGSVSTVASFPLSPFPHPHHAFEGFGGTFFTRPELNDESTGANTDGTVFAWMGVGPSFLSGFLLISGPGGAERQNEEIWNNPWALSFHRTGIPLTKILVLSVHRSMHIVAAKVSGFDDPFPALDFEAWCFGGLIANPVLRD
jgi:hypothetical protein